MIPNVSNNVTSGNQQSIRETMIFNVKLLYFVFLPFKITRSVCFVVEKNSADKKHLVNDES